MPFGWKYPQNNVLHYVIGRGYDLFFWDPHVLKRSTPSSDCYEKGRSKKRSADELSFKTSSLTGINESLFNLSRERGKMCVSYGTLLGQTFASMFPERMGKVVLDGIVDPDDWVAGIEDTTLADLGDA
ncbi:hypothetical protein B0O99DRAFT_671077 [Bisporella sp. PMI_857]|nr:hypothetical protein B0O99DRAFT_671077 [Bisporella sp. PMI_857]